MIILMAFSFSLIAVTTAPNTAHAAPITCPAQGATTGTPEPADSEDTCKYEGIATCPPGFTPISSGDPATCKKEASTNTANSTQLQNQISAILSVQGALNRMLWPILTMIGGLMDNSLLFGNGMEARLREIWVPIRNLVNILFVIALIGIALYNVLGIGEESGNYSIKSVLPKIIVGIIAVNFSFLGMKVFLDTVNVVTVSIFNLPNQVGAGLDQIVDSEKPEDKLAIERFCSQVYGEKFNTATQEASVAEEFKLIQTRIVAQDSKFGVSKPQNMTVEAIRAEIQGKPDGAALIAEFDEKLKAMEGSMICESHKTLTPQGKQFLSRWGAQNAALAMAINMGKVVFYEDVEVNSKTIDKLLINVIFSALMYIIFVISFIALFVVLLARLVVLWISIVVSPILILAMAVPVVKEKLEALNELTTQFVKNAIAPIGIALAMTVGWIMLGALQSVNGFDTSTGIPIPNSGGIPVVGLNTLQDLVVALGTVAVVWVGVFSAANETIASSVTEKLQEWTKAAGQFIAVKPILHSNFIPIKLGDQKIDASLSQLDEVIDRAKVQQSSERTKLADLIFGGGAPPLTGTKNWTDPQDSANTIFSNKAKIESGDEDARGALRDFQKSEAYRAMRADPKYSKVLPLIDKYVGAEEKSERAALGKKLTAELKRAGATEIKRDASGAKDTKAKDAKALPAISPQTMFAGKSVEKHEADKGKQGELVRELETARDGLIGAADQGKDYDIRRALNAFKLKVAGNDEVPTAEQLKEYLGEENYNKVIIKMGKGSTDAEKKTSGEAALKKELTDIKAGRSSVSPTTGVAGQPGVAVAQPAARQPAAEAPAPEPERPEPQPPADTED